MGGRHCAIVLPFWAKARLAYEGYMVISDSDGRRKR